MADRIKKFFNKKKADIRFKQAGPGRKLTDDSSTSKQVGDRAPSSAKPQPKQDMSEERRLAAQAALMRLNNEKKRDNPNFNTSLSAIKAQVKRELELEKQAKVKEEEEKNASSSVIREVNVEASPHLAVSGVFFKCPLINNKVLSKEEWKHEIRHFLYEQLATEEGLTACLIIQSCNSGKERIESCVETLCKYLDNIVIHPDEEKYHKIRKSNKVFCEKIQGLEGSLELLHAAGFRNQKIANKDTGIEEEFLVFNIENVESIESLTMLIDALRSAEPITLELDRNLQVLLPSQAATRTDLPPQFFSVSQEELKRDLQLRNEAIEKSLILRTKAMREKDEIKELRKYKYALIRIRFPDGILLQGTFSVYDNLGEVYSFVKENLEHEGLPFVLISPDGSKLSEEEFEKTLMDLKLVPATILTFKWDSSVAEEINKSNQRDVYLKPEVLLLVSDG